MTFIIQASNSKLDTYKDCPWKYYIRYHEHMPEKRSDTALQFGSYIHKIFERGMTELTMSGLELIAEEEKANFKFTKEYLPKIPICLKNFLQFNTKLSSKTTNVGSELRESYEIEKDITYVGIIDRVVKAEDGSIMIIDYKTSRVEKTRMDLAMDNQLLGYAVMCSKKYSIPINKITCAHYYPLTNNFIPITFMQSKISQFIREIKEQVWKIRKKTKEQFLPVKNKFCNWCGFKYCCPLFESPLTVTKIIQEHKDENKLQKKNPKSKGV